MPRAGETIENPITGETTTFVVTSGDSDGAMLQLDVVIEPGHASPPVHVHRAFAEIHDLREGTLGIAS